GVQQSAEAGQIDADMLGELEREVAADPLPYRESDHCIAFPVPHPLDYDWRFADASVEYLLETCAGVSADDQVIALLGAPALMRAAIECGFPRQMRLLDADRRLVRAFAGHAPENTVFHCEIGLDPLPEIQADVIVADPPWYEEYLDPFLFAASQLCVVGGSLILA